MLSSIMVQLEKRSKKNKNYLGIDIYKRFFIDQKNEFLAKRNS